MPFSIQFLRGYEKRKSRFKTYGEITIGDFSEVFEASLTYWKREDYKEQWKNALLRIVAGDDKGALITSMYDPTIANFITWWPMYREGKSVFIQNGILFLKEIPLPFQINNLNNYIEDRETIDNDGHRISEWMTNIMDIEKFTNEL